MPKGQITLKDWFKGIYSRLEALPPTRLTLLLVAVGLLFSLLGLWGGTLFISQTETIIEQNPVLPRMEEREAGKTESSAQGSLISLTGLVKKNLESPERASHVLFNDEGKLITYLIADDAKLDLVEDTKVELRGEYSNANVGDYKTFQVAKIVLK